MDELDVAMITWLNRKGGKYVQISGRGPYKQRDNNRYYGIRTRYTRFFHAQLVDCMNLDIYCEPITEFKQKSG